MTLDDMLKVLEICSIVGGVIVVVWKGGTWSSSVSVELEHVKDSLDRGFEANEAAHRDLYQELGRVAGRVTDHGERLSRVEGTVRSGHA